MNTTTSYKRINITLPEVTLELLENTIEKGKRSEFLDQAVRYFIKNWDSKSKKRITRSRPAKIRKRFNHGA